VAEVQLWKWLRPWLPRGRYSRIESPDTAPGFPDVNYRIAKAEGNIELKDARSKNPTIPFPNEDKGLHRSQLNWISDQVFFNGIVWVVARVGPQVFWVSGIHAGAFNGATMKRLKFLASYVHEDKPDVRKLKRMLEGEL
jgi:hypothetical protein